MDAFRESTRVELVVVQRNDIGYDDESTDPTLPTESPMIIKHADDKTTDIDILQALLTHPSATPDIRKRIEQEVRNIKAGVRGESEATQEMKVRYGESRNWAIIHDLRVEFGDLVAQIDHLVINRWLDIWVCESKHFSEGVAINNHGEFTAFFNHKPYGVPSPIEQNERHILILKRILDAGMVELPKRLGFTIKPDLKSLVLVSKGARISRPEVKIDGIECVIKNDQFFKHVDKAVDENGILATAKIVGSDTLENVATQLARLHKPIRFDWPAKFGLSKLPPQPIPTPAVPAEPPAMADPKVSQPKAPEVVPPPKAAPSTPQPPAATSGTPVCRACGSAKISAQYGKFGYYFKCTDCDGNTPIKIGCGVEGHKERIRKEGLKFYRECADCKTSSLFFENSQ